jgi:hypothetical protein
VSEQRGQFFLVESLLPTLFVLRVREQVELNLHDKSGIA